MKKGAVCAVLVLALWSGSALPARATFGEDASAIIAYLGDGFINLLINQGKAMFEQVIMSKVQALFLPAEAVIDKYERAKNKLLHWGPFGVSRNSMDVFRELSQGGIDPNAGVVFRMAPHIPHPSVATGYGGGAFPTGGWSGGWSNPHPNVSTPNNGWGSTGGWSNTGGTTPTPGPSPTPTPTPEPSPTPTPTPTPSTLLFDDEFNGSSSFSGSYSTTFVNNSTAYSDPLVTINTAVPGHLRDGASNTFPSYYGALPAYMRGAYVIFNGQFHTIPQIGVETDITVVARVVLPDAPQGDRTNEAGIVLNGYSPGNGPTGGYLSTMQVVQSFGNTTLTHRQWVNYQYDYESWGPGTAITSGAIWLRMVRQGGTWYGSGSSDGIHWTDGVLIHTPGDNSSISSVVINSAGVWASCRAYGQSYYDFDFFRIYEGIVDNVPETLPGSGAGTLSMMSPSSFRLRTNSAGSAVTAVTNDASPPGGASSVGLGDYTSADGIVMDFRPFNGDNKTGTIFGTIRVFVRTVLAGLVWASLIFWCFRQLSFKFSA